MNIEDRFRKCFYLQPQFFITQDNKGKYVLDKETFITFLQKSTSFSGSTEEEMLEFVRRIFGKEGVDILKELL
jgi:hypothetical protein